MKKTFTFLVVILSLVSCSETQEKTNNRIVNHLKSEVKDTLKDFTSQEKTRNTVKQINQNLDEYEQSMKLENYLIDKIPSKDFITISENTVIFTNPDNKQIKRFKKEIGEESFYIAADDNSWYQFEALEYFEKKKITILNPDKRYLKFITRDKKVYNFDTKAKFAGWETILYRPDSLPKIVNPVGIEEEDSLYFGK